MEYKTVTVEKKRFGITRIISLFIGVFTMFVAVLLFITIIGILPGLGLSFLSLPFFAIALGGARYECPNCGFNKNFVTTGKVNDSCRRCKQNIAIDWIKPYKKKRTKILQ
ncbi:hypothetical protein C6W27_09075 [Bacillus paralicheniformis]|uniref:hypothetical protein n=1 Tax=Bacillus paralicheniformis TaxID=1648923 RepID=UPI000D028AD4|nr:hypothetical protein [Bacillus paralicheniformis]MED4309151.1 hypothetical protein [Bacillus paralicheniformis]MED4346961.1 hypothetical protein [Bacillus paralicheniformis]PRS16541.1 hypothetical protein C6W27_09075 [Bacillus paralicheniformis]